MCYKKPGPRCSSYALKQYNQACKTQDDAEKANDFNAWEKAEEKRELSKFQFYMTPKGQKVLTRALEKASAAGNHRKVVELDSLQSRALQARREALSAIGLMQDSGDTNFSHHDGTVERTLSISINPDEVTVNESDFPHPQANRLDKVSTVVDAINNDASTASSIAQTLDVVDRQGYYYADAAGYLGLVETFNSGELKEYGLTTLGQQFAESDEVGRAEILKRQIAGMPLMQVYVEQGSKAAQDFMQGADDTSDVTVKRRLATLEAWKKDIGSDSLAQAIKTDSQSSSARVVDAAGYAAEQRKRHSNVKAPLSGKVCSTCFTVKSLSGVCANCD